jgi:hypothetical protein
MLVIVWPFVGIAVKHAATPIVANSTWVAVGLVIVVYFVGVWQTRKI